jgi:hypothetical protein
MKNVNEFIINRVVEALQADSYIVRLIHTDNLNGIKNKDFPLIHGIYTADALLKSAKFFAAKNAQGYNIYFRPQSYEYILLDDITKDQLAPIAEIKPCLLIETSPNNYQVWLRLQSAPTDREHAKEICRYLAEKYHADKGSAEPDHIGRLPSYTNRKPKYNQANGTYPFVILHKSENRKSIFFLPKGFIVLKENAQPAPMLKEKEKKENTPTDRSRYDFNNVCMWLRQRKSYTDIYNLLNSSSDKADGRVGEHKEKYLTNTIKNAIQRTGIQPKL